MAAAGQKLWDKTYGGSDWDQASAVTMTKDGGALLAGYTSSKGAGSKDMYLVRVDKNGQKLWDKTYGGSEWDKAYAMTMTKDGGALLAGYTSSKGAGSNDMYLVRVDKDGQKLWDKTYGGSKRDLATAITMTKDGGALLAGVTSSKGAGGEDMYLVRVDKDGQKLWDKTYGGSYDDVAYAVTLTKDGGALLAGRTSSKGAGGYDMYLVRVDNVLETGE